MQLNLPPTGPTVSHLREEAGALLPECNHRTVAILVLVSGMVGGLLEIAGPPPMILPRLVLFLGLFVAGGFYLGRVVRRSRRVRSSLKTPFIWT
jgi:hypothetical protein